MAKTKKIIDVAKHQGVINWDAAKGEIDGAILQCGYGSDYIYQDDIQFERNANECERLGIPYGIYLYSYAMNDDKAHSEASHAIRLAQGRKLSYPIYFDAEQDGTESVAKRNAEIFCKDVEKAGYFAGIYANENWWNNIICGLDKYTKWVAKYSSSSPNVPKYDAWQYTDCEPISGIGNVDCSYFYRDFPKEIGGNTAKKKEKKKENTANGKSLDDIAKEIVKGKWGNGKKRTQKLKAAGFTQAEINEIQKKVNNRIYKAVAKQIVAGKWGNGQERIDRLHMCGYDDAAITKIQKKVNKLMGE